MMRFGKHRNWYLTVLGVAGLATVTTLGCEAGVSSKREAASTYEVIPSCPANESSGIGSFEVYPATNEVAPVDNAGNILGTVDRTSNGDTSTTTAGGNTASHGFDNILDTTASADGVTIQVTTDGVVDQSNGSMHITYQSSTGDTYDATADSNASPSQAFLDWFNANGGSVVQNSPAGQLEGETQRDPNLYFLYNADAGISPAHGTASVPGEFTNIHNSLVCENFFSAAAGVVAGISCGICIPAIPATVATGGWGAVVALPSCITCAASTGVGLTQIIACVVSKYVKAIDNCMGQNLTCGYGLSERVKGGTGTDSGHVCECYCSDSHCNNQCRADRHRGGQCNGAGDTCTCFD